MSFVCESKPRDAVAGLAADAGEEPAHQNLAIGLHRKGLDIIVRVRVKAVKCQLGAAGRRQTDQQRDGQSVKRGDQ